MNNNYPFQEVTLALTPRQLEFLTGATGGVSHFAIFASLVGAMATEPTSFDKRGIDVPLLPRQVEASANSLSSRWGIGRKGMTRILSMMSDVGLLRLAPSKLTSVATIVAVRSWTPTVTGTTPAADEGQQTPAAEPAEAMPPTAAPTPVVEAATATDAEPSEAMATAAASAPVTPTAAIERPLTVAPRPTAATPRPGSDGNLFSQL